VASSWAQNHNRTARPIRFGRPTLALQDDLKRSCRFGNFHAQSWSKIAGQFKIRHASHYDWLAIQGIDLDGHRSTIELAQATVLHGKGSSIQRARRLGQMSLQEPARASSMIAQ
jgi:hypothetical protein